MDHEEVGRYWDENAEVWTQLVRDISGNFVRNARAAETEKPLGIDYELASAVVPPFRIPVFTRTLSSWLNGLIDAGFVVERLGEPCPGDVAIREHPGLQDAQVVAYFLHVRVRKPQETEV